jgi:hypothetical protein
MIKNGREKKHKKSTIFGNRFYDFRTTFSNIFKEFWSTNFARIEGNISREKKKPQGSHEKLSLLPQPLFNAVFSNSKTFACAMACF